MSVLLRWHLPLHFRLQQIEQISPVISPSPQCKNMVLPALVLGHKTCLPFHWSCLEPRSLTIEQTGEQVGHLRLWNLHDIPWQFFDTCWLDAVGSVQHSLRGIRPFVHYRQSTCAAMAGAWTGLETGL